MNNIVVYKYKQKSYENTRLIFIFSYKECLKKNYQKTPSIQNKNIYKKKNVSYYAILDSHPVETAK